MKKEKETKVGVNQSSGAKKVEVIEKEKKVQTKKDGTGYAMKEKKTDTKAVNSKAEKESENAKRRVEKALKKQEEKRKRQEERKARFAEKQRERAHEKANRNKERARAKEVRRQRREEERIKRAQKEKRPNYGGWLAGVISLGTATLALATAVTIGAIDMAKTKKGVASSYQSTTYELVGISGHIDDDLDRVRLSASPEQQGRILTDLLVQARLAEADLEKMPVCAEDDCHLTSFFNKVASTSERLLGKLRMGEELNEKDEQELQALYATAHNVRGMLDEYTQTMGDMDLMDYVQKGKGAFADVMKGLEEATLPENGELTQMDGAGMSRMPISQEDKEQVLSPAQAEEMCKTYFSDYKIDQFVCIGETLASEYTAYNLQGYDDNGTLLFAEVDAKKGELIRFDYYEECVGENFTMENSQTLAENFLQKLGYDDMTAVRVRENGTDVDFEYVYTQDGIVCYPDSVHVKVCRSRGVVTGMDAEKYQQNHKQRGEITPKISLAEAQNALHKGVEVEASRLAVVQTRRGERPAYEFLATYQGEKYLIYTDALSGVEISIVNVNKLG